MRAKAWAFQNGHIKADGRGRMPKVSMLTGESLTTVLSDSGVKFSDWPKGEIVTKVNEETKVAETSVKRDVSEAGMIEPIPYRFHPDEFQAVEFDTKKIRSVKEACFHCGVSLVVCYCAKPEIVACNGRGHVRVSIERK